MFLSRHSSTIGAIAALAGGVGAPLNTVLPAISDTTPAYAQVLTTTDGTWTGSPTFAYQWFYSVMDETDEPLYDDDDLPLGIEITGETTNTYTVVAGDVGERLFVEITATNAGGVVVACSAVTGIVSAAGTAVGLLLLLTKAS